MVTVELRSSTALEETYVNGVIACYALPISHRNSKNYKEKAFVGRYKKNNPDIATR